MHQSLTHTSGIGDYAEEDEDAASYVDNYAGLWSDRPSHLMERPLDFLPTHTRVPTLRRT